MGNISLQGYGAVGDAVIAPAEGGTERAEHAAEGEFMDLEMGVFEQYAAREAHGGGGAVMGDAPAAGDGLQASPDQDADEEGHGRGRTSTTPPPRPPAADF